VSSFLRSLHIPHGKF